MLTAVASLTLDPSNNALSTLLDAISVEAGAHFTFAHEHRTSSTQSSRVIRTRQRQPCESMSTI